MGETAKPGLALRFWGVRGSIPVPGPRTRRYGGNTSCVEVRAGEEPILVDAGTGIREFGLSLDPSAAPPPRIHIFVTHTHWDHIQGLPFFNPIYSPNYDISIYGPRPLEGSLENAILHQLQYNYFPVRGVELAARLQFRELGEETIRIGPLTITTKSMNHPVRVLGLRLSRDEKSVVYTGDNEPYYDILMDPSRPDTMMVSRRKFVEECREGVVDFVRGADILVADAQYTDEEYEKKRGWGHSSIGHALELARQADAKTLVLFHHEPLHPDAQMDAISRDARARARREGGPRKVVVAREGLALEA